MRKSLRCAFAAFAIVGVIGSPAVSAYAEPIDSTTPVPEPPPVVIDEPPVQAPSVEVPSVEQPQAPPVEVPAQPPAAPAPQVPPVVPQEPPAPVDTPPVVQAPKPDVVVPKAPQETNTPPTVKSEPTVVPSEETQPPQETSTAPTQEPSQVPSSDQPTTEGQPTSANPSPPADTPPSEVPQVGTQEVQPPSEEGVPANGRTGNPDDHQYPPGNDGRPGHSGNDDHQGLPGHNDDNDGHHNQPPVIPPPANLPPIPDDWRHQPPVHEPPHQIPPPPSHDWNYPWHGHQPPRHDATDATFVSVRVVVNVNTGLPEFYSDVNVVVKVMDNDRPGHFMEFPVGPGRPYTPDYNWCGSRGGYNWAGVNVSTPGANVFAGAGSYRPDDHCGKRWDGRQNHQKAVSVGVWVQVYVNQPPVYVREVEDCGDHIIVNRTTFIYGSKSTYKGQPLWVPRAEKPYTVNPLAPDTFTQEVPPVFQGYLSGQNPTDESAQAASAAQDNRLEHAAKAAGIVGGAAVVIGGLIWYLAARRRQHSDE